MKLALKIIFVVLLFILIAVTAGGQEERKGERAAVNYLGILRAAYAKQDERDPGPSPEPLPPLVPAPANELPPRRSGHGPQQLPATLQAPANDLPGDAELEARRAAGGAGKLRVVPKPPRDFSLEALSQFLGDGESCVILPKGAVIHCPEALEVRMPTTPRGKLMAWPEFLVAHRAWITTREVSQEQIRGEVAFTEGDRAAFHNGGKLVVATFRGHPVTVLTPVPTPP
jgi:hypothetical protein